MNNPDIELKIKTTGDTSGAEAVTAALKDTGKAAKSAEAESAAAEKQQVAVNDREANLRIQAGNWAKVAETVRGYGAAVKVAAKDLEFLDDKAKSVVRSVAEYGEAGAGYVATVASAYRVGGPWIALFAGVTQGMAAVLKTFAETSKVFEDVETAGARQVEMWKNLQRLKVVLPIVESLEATNKLLDEEEQKLLRNARIREADRSLIATIQGEAGKAAVADGQTTAAGAEAVNLAQQLADNVAKIREPLEDAALQANAGTGGQGVAGTAVNASSRNLSAASLHGSCRVHSVPIIGGGCGAFGIKTAGIWAQKPAEKYHFPAGLDHLACGLQLVKDPPARWVTSRWVHGWPVRLVLSADDVVV